MCRKSTIVRCECAKIQKKRHLCRKHFEVSSLWMVKTGMCSPNPLKAGKTGYQVPVASMGTALLNKCIECKARNPETGNRRRFSAQEHSVQQLFYGIQLLAGLVVDQRLAFCGFLLGGVP